MKYAVIKTGGNQYRVSEGDELLIDNLNLEEGKAVDFDSVALFVDDQKVKIGTPILGDVVVKARVMGNEKGEKIRVARYKAKSRYHKVRGYRHAYTRVKIESISPSSAKKTSKKTS